MCWYNTCQSDTNKNTCVKKGQVRLIKTVCQKKYWDLMCCQVQYHQFNKWVKNIVTPIKTHFFHLICPSIFVEFTFLVEIIFLNLGFYALLYMSRIMLPYHEIIIREDGAVKREGWRPYQTIIIIIIIII